MRNGGSGLFDDSIKLIPEIGTKTVMCTLFCHFKKYMFSRMIDSVEFPQHGRIMIGHNFQRQSYRLHGTYLLRFGLPGLMTAEVRFLFFPVSTPVIHQRPLLRIASTGKNFPTNSRMHQTNTPAVRRTKGNTFVRIRRVACTFEEKVLRETVEGREDWFVAP